MVIPEISRCGGDPVAFGIILAIMLILGFFRIRKQFSDDPVTYTRIFKKTKLTPDQLLILEKYFDYYTNLPTEELKNNFRRRVAIFISEKEYIPAGGLTEISEEMKVLISASAIQLAFGIPGVYLQHFSKIIIFPEEFRLPDSDNTYDGNVNLKGAIFLSWKNFLLGYKYPEDGRNLGLHELAHALYFENAYKNDEFDFLDRRALLEFAVMTKRELEKMHKGECDFFRDYAAKNRHEFFAVAVESFFERPKEFRENIPDLYDTLAALLNQDTAEGKYILKKVPKKLF